MQKYLVLFLGVSLFLTGCDKNDDDGIGGPSGPDPDPSADVTVQDFMWQGLNLWYFWQADAPNLGDNRFDNSADYTAYLQTYDNPSDFFFNTCYMHERIVGESAAIDRFSFVSDDYKELTQNLSGVSRNNGVDYQLYLFSNSNDVYGIVRYILPNSDASTKDITRGDIFTGVDGESLFFVDENNNNLNLLEANTYTLNMADIFDGTITPNGQEVTLTKAEGFAENPVFITKSFDISGKKIGYLMYNGFTNEFDEDLNDAFGQLKADNVTDLVLDLRYNGGGSVNSSRLLSSMIYGTNTNDLYIKQRWNPKIQEAFTRDDPNALDDYFADTTGDGSAINTLNLSTVYILTTRSTASASELVINGLNPYMNVVKIGTTTTGKNEFSITMVDDPDREGAPFLYTPSRENQINPDNRWAMQPLMGRNENSVGFLDYTAGFAPDIQLSEDLENFGILGDVNEPLLARAIQEITGITSKQKFTVKMPSKPFTNSKMLQPLKDNMVLDKLYDMNLNLVIN